MEDREVVAGLIVASFGAGWIIGRNRMKSLIRKNNTEAAIKRAEIVDLLVELQDYIVRAAFDDSVSMEEYNRVINEKKQFIMIVKSM